MKIEENGIFLTWKKTIIMHNFLWCFKIYSKIMIVTFIYIIKVKILKQVFIYRVTTVLYQ